MSQILGIGVITQDNLSHIIGLAQATRSAGKQVKIFLTGDGVHLTQEARFTELLGVGQVEICRTSYDANGYQDQEIPGLPDEAFTSQFRHAEILEKCDRYIVL